MTKSKTKPQHSTATKEELERKKIELEIKDLERPFWKRPVYVLAALPKALGRFPQLDKIRIGID